MPEPRWLKNVSEIFASKLHHHVLLYASIGTVSIEGDELQKGHHIFKIEYSPGNAQNLPSLEHCDTNHHIVCKTNDVVPEIPEDDNNKKCVSMTMLSATVLWLSVPHLKIQVARQLMLKRRLQYLSEDEEHKPTPPANEDEEHKPTPPANEDKETQHPSSGEVTRALETLENLFLLSDHVEENMATFNRL
ncbi:hypothetical protein PR048_032154 [Dryococelus australis]|uniref:Uncharacterized protein n=1 Tax=Dryococelus australis TaxID=614101 RepID=A0ABQ9G5J3_9NEOP|nr:hypothetical protein PR048_032154 [Dryococelus australis]